LVAKPVTIHQHGLYHSKVNMRHHCCATAAQSISLPGGSCADRSHTQTLPAAGAIRHPALPPHAAICTALLLLQLLQVAVLLQLLQVAVLLQLLLLQVAVLLQLLLLQVAVLLQLLQAAILLLLLMPLHPGCTHLCVAGCEVLVV
jgi:hypothetical protein